MRENYTLPRLYLDTPLSGGAEIELPKEQAHYLGSVIRKKAGDALRAFNGEDGEWLAELTQASKRKASVKLIRPLRAPMQSPDVTLIFAPVRKHRTAFILSLIHI